MEKIHTVWGGVIGKIVAACLVLAVICGAAALSLANAAYGKVLLTVDEVGLENSADKGDGNLSVGIRVDKPGFYLADYKTYKDGDRLMVKLYASVKVRNYKMDSAGVYTLNLKIDKNIKTVVQEGKGNDEEVLARLNHKG